MRPEDITDEHVKLASGIAGRAFAKMPTHAVANYDDLRADALYGLVLAARSYDPSRGTTFRTHAIARIEGAIMDGLRDRDHMTRGQRRKHTHAERARQQFILHEQRYPTTNEWAIASKLDSNELGQLVHGDQPPLSLHRPTAADDNDGLTLADTIPDDNDPIEQADAHADITEHMGCLTSREHVVIWLNFWEGLNQREIGDILGVTESRVSQIKAEALTKMRAKLATAA